MKLFQNIDYLGMLSLKFMPGNFNAFVEFFGGGILELIPNPFDGAQYSDFKCPKSKKWVYFQEDGTCGYLKESGVPFLIFCILLTVKGIVLALNRKPQTKVQLEKQNKLGGVEDLNNSQVNLKSDTKLKEQPNKTSKPII
jgi:hypothetical protein